LEFIDIWSRCRATTTVNSPSLPGRLLKAPENFLEPAGVRQVFAQARSGRRDFIRNAFAAAAAGAVSMPKAA
jgi:sulfane dehydrogenase subunit SoxC